MPSKKLSKARFMAAVHAVGTKSKCLAKYLELSERTVRRYKTMYLKNHERPELLDPTVYGVSALQRGDENEPLKWVKYRQTDQQRQIAFENFIAALQSDIEPAKPIPSPVTSFNSQLLNTYILTDYHLGMYAWHEESGEDWDIRIAEDLLIRWFQQAIKQAPDSETAILAELGDFLHFDSLSAVTPSSGHLLDADTRFPLIVRAAIRVLRTIIQLLLEKHKYVHIILCTGNHDEASSIWLREILASFYENEPRLSICTSSDVYYGYQFNNVSLFFHHGHKRNIKNIDSVFARKFREMFGNTDYSYAHIGHLHNAQVHETNLMTIEQHPTLAAKDAYAAHGGWISHRSAKVITYHSQHGKCGEIVITPEMIQNE